LANSASIADLVAVEQGVPPHKIVEVPNFLEENAFSTVDEMARTEQRKAWGIPDGAFVIGIVARLSPVKNHPLLLQAVARLDSRFHLVAIGDGPDRHALEDLARTLGVASRVHFVGEVLAPQNLHQYLDVSVLCSQSEGFPNSVIEAMAAARPVIATHVGGVPDAVGHGETGLLVPSNDPEPLASALRTLADAPALRARLGEAGRASARRKYHQSHVLAQLTGLYRDLAARRAAAYPGHSHV
jgi:glycosyltransferase involved in cell wall biosynthesis